MKWLNYLTSGLNVWELTERFQEMAKIFGKWLRYMRRAKVFQVRHKHVANDLHILNMASMCGGRLKYLRNGFTMLKMT